MPNSPPQPLFLAILLAYLVALTGCDSHLPSKTPATTPRPTPVPAPSPQLSQARTLLIQGNHRRAADLYRQTLNSHPGSVPAYIGLAQASLRLGDFPAAIAACTTGLKRDSTSLVLFNSLAAAYSGTGRYALAIETLEQCLHHHPDFDLGHVNIGGMYGKLGHYQEAEKHLLMARRLNPDNPVTHRRLGELFLKTGRPDSALSELSTALISHPSSETLYYLRGQALERTGRQVVALQDYQRAHNLDPGFAEAHYLTATLGRRLGRTALADSALQAYQQLRDIGQQDQQLNKQFKALRASILDSPEDPLHHFQLGRFFAHQGFDRAALHRFRRVLELNPNDLRAHNQVGRILLRGRNPAAALQHFERALALDSAYAPARINAGNACMLLRQYPRATTHYRAAVELRPEMTLVWHHLAKSHLAMNEKGAAAQALRQGLAQAKPDDKMRGAIQDLLTRIE